MMDKTYKMMNQIRHEYIQTLYSLADTCVFGSHINYMFLVSTLNKIKIEEKKNESELDKACSEYIFLKLRIFRQDIISDLNPEYYYLEDSFSILELLLCFASLAGDIDKHFWKFIDNLGLSEFTDDVWVSHALFKIEKKITKWLSKKYKMNGVGSAFRLNDYLNDQKKLSILQQFEYYKKENCNEKD